MPPKTKCPISRQDFTEQAEPVVVKINDLELLADVKEFSTGSFGWYLNAKTTVKVGNKSIPVQIGLNVAVVGSKEAE